MSRLKLRSLASALILIACVAMPTALAAKPLATAAITKAQTELTSRLTARNLALRELAKQLMATTPKVAVTPSVVQARIALARYQRATAGTVDSTLGGSELVTLHKALIEASKALKASPSDASAVALGAAIEKTRKTQMAARNAKAALLRTQLAAIR